MTTNQTIDGVPRDTVEITRELAEQLTEGWNGVNARIELRKMLDADKVNNRQMGLMQFVGAHPIKPAAQPQREPVAFLDIGAGGYVDLGTDQPLEALEKLPYGRHMLGIIGTYGADGWQPIVKHPTTEIEPVAYAVLADNGNIRVWTRSPEVVEIICGQGLTPVPLYAEQPAPVAVVMSFDFEHPSSKERRTVALSKQDVFDGLEDYFYDKIGEQICRCESVGETNVVDCSCDEYVHDFEIVKASLTS